MVTSVSKVKIDQQNLSKNDDRFIPRLVIAADEGRVMNPALVDALIGRGNCGRVNRHQTLSEMDGDWN